MCDWTPDAVAALLDRNDLAVERAVVAIFNRQTSDEQESESTKHDNGRGISAFHAGLGSYYARWIQSGRHLTGPHLERARKMMHRYVGQLAEVAQSHQSHPVKEYANVA
jgi:hypothetical protein